MKSNMGTMDKAIRILVALVILILYLTNVINGLVATIGLVVSGVFMLTSLIGFCPLYLPLGWSTQKKDKK